MHSARGFAPSAGHAFCGTQDCVPRPILNTLYRIHDFAQFNFFLQKTGSLGKPPIEPRLKDCKPNRQAGLLQKIAAVQLLRESPEEYYQKRTVTDSAKTTQSEA